MFAIAFLPTTFPARADSHRHGLKLARPHRRTGPKAVARKVSSYRVLPDTLSNAERPSRPHKHHSVPVLGFALERLFGVATRCDEKHRRYGAVYWSDYQLKRTTYVADYATIVDVLRDPERFPACSAAPNLIGLFGEDNINNLDGPEHTALRKLVAPAFAAQLLPYYFDTVRKRVEGAWTTAYSRASAGETLLLDSVFRELYLGIVIEMTTGVRWGTDRMGTLLKHCGVLLDALSIAPFGPVWTSALRARDRVRATLAQVVRDRLRNDAAIIDILREQGDDESALHRLSPNDEVDVLLVSIAKSGLSTAPGAELDEDTVGVLVRIIMVLWLAGFSTAAVTSACASFELGWNSELYSRLTKEQDALVVESGTREVSFDQLTEMPLLEGFLNEILRLRPASPGAGRRTVRDVELLGAYVPDGDVIYLDFFTAHRDPKLYTNPETIDPERWSRKPKPPAVLSFGAPGSPHYCIGALLAKMFMRTAFATLLRRYTYTLDPKQSRAYQPFETMPVSMSVPESLVVVQHFNERATEHVA